MPTDTSGPFDRFDVAISGAGLAGASLALRLTRCGLRVAVLDAGRFPRDKLCGEFLSPEGCEALDRLGVADELDRAGFEPILAVRLTTPRGSVLEADVVGPNGRPGMGLSRSALDDLLVRTACVEGAFVIQGARVGGALVEGERVVGLVARLDGHSKPVEVRASVTVAADGRHSALVRRTGKTRSSSCLRPRHFGLKCHLEVDDPRASEPPGTVGLHLIPGGYIGSCRVEGALTNLCGLMPASVVRRHRGDLARLAREEFARNPTLERLWAAARPIGPWKTVTGVRVEASSPVVEGILYAGDCQGTVDPLGGQGMTMALLGAELLAPIVLDALARGGVDRDLQRRCEVAWHRRFDRRVRLCRVFHHVLINPFVVDLASGLGEQGSRLLAVCYGWTRDAGWVPGAVPSR